MPSSEHKNRILIPNIETIHLIPVNDQFSFM